MINRFIHLIFGRPKSSNSSKIAPLPTGVYTQATENEYSSAFEKHIPLLRYFVSNARYEIRLFAKAKTVEIVQQAVSFLEEKSFIQEHKKFLKKVYEETCDNKQYYHNKFGAKSYLAWFAGQLFSRFSYTVGLIPNESEEKENFRRKLENDRVFQKIKQDFEREGTVFLDNEKPWFYSKYFDQLNESINILLQLCKQYGTIGEIESYIQSSNRPYLYEFEHRYLGHFTNELLLNYQSNNYELDYDFLNTFYVQDKRFHLKNGQVIYLGFPKWLQSLTVYLVLLCDYYFSNEKWPLGASFRFAIDNIFSTSNHEEIYIVKQLLQTLYAFGMPRSETFNLESHYYYLEKDIDILDYDPIAVLVEVYPVFLSNSISLDTINSIVYYEPSKIRELQINRESF
ncbi:MAG: hypothetical protein DHS20C13_22080 [Thermodesulfobacteriota bacterium]|nr:MAG: hypothetical protein DHS20C13_22080 [Thermodesulfobacteriota bacterium]